MKKFITLMCCVMFLTGMCGIVNSILGAKGIEFTGKETEQVLPDWAIPVEYLESSGTQYIDTGIYANNSLKVFCKIEVTARAINGYTIFGAAKGDGTLGIRDAVALAEKYNYPQTLFLLDTYNNQNQISIDYGTPLEVLCDIGTGTITINGVSNTHKSLPLTGTATYPIFLFGENLKGALYRGCKARMMAWYVVSAENIIMNLVPVRFLNENDEYEGAMYDFVSGELFRNHGSGSFLIGPDKH